jgi:hypothetical protein
LFFIAALTEMSNKERQLATDPDCSNILERMIYSMDDFARRVLLTDCLARELFCFTEAWLNILKDISGMKH